MTGLRRGPRAALVATLLLVAGCDLVASAPPADPGAFASVGPTTSARFVRAVDGDTIHVEIDGRRVTVRLIGLDAPERARDGVPAEPLADEATDAAGALLDETPQLLLERDRSETDRFGRLLRYVWKPVDGGWRLVNEELVRLGMADARDYRPDTSRQERLEEAEREARGAGLGIWAVP